MSQTDFEDALAKIRPHTTSKQAHQRKPAQLLVALESTLKESTKASDTDERNPTAYFAALLTTLEGCISHNDMDLEDGSTLPAILYLLALVLPYVPALVLRAHLPKIFQHLPPLLPLVMPAHAPPLRSLISVLGVALGTMDQGLVYSTMSISSSLGGNLSVGTSTSASIRHTFATILELVLDSRPKVRKRAGEVVKTVLESPPAPLATHPWGSLVAEWSCGVVAQRSAGGGGREETVESLVHLMAFLRTIPFIFSTTPVSARGGTGEELRSVETMTRYLLAMPKLSNPYLTQASYQLLTALLTTDGGSEGDVDDDVYTQRKREQVAAIQRTLLSTPTLKADAQSGPYWLMALSQATVASRPTAKLQAKVPVDVWTTWQRIWQYLDASCPPTTRLAAGEALCNLVQGGCIKWEHLAGLSGPTKGVPIKPLLDSIEKSLGQLAYASSIGQILEVLTTLAKYSSPLNTSAGRDFSSDPATIHQRMKSSHPLIPLLDTMAKLRISKGFDYKGDVDKFLAAMIGAVGVDTVIERIPLGILPKERPKCWGAITSQEAQPNAYLLPLIPNHHPTPLSHFTSYFIPLSEGLWELAEKSEKDAEKKVYRVLMEQVWNTFPSYCRGCWDMRQTFTPQLAERLTQVLYHEPTLRPAILRGLKAIAEANTLLLRADASGGDNGPSDESILEDGVDDGEIETERAGIRYQVPTIKRSIEHASPFTREQAKENITYLNDQAKSWLAVLFNVFTSMEKESRAMVGSVISVWAGISSEPELAGAYRNVLSHLQQNLAITSEEATKNATSAEFQKAVVILNQMLDILLLLVPHLPAAQLRQVITLFLDQGILEHPDGGVQKLGYRVLNRVVLAIVQNAGFSQSEKHDIVEKLLTGLGGAADVSSGAIKERLGLLSVLIQNLSPDSLHLLASHLMEPIMGVKEHSEKVRKAAFELLVVMGRKMKDGGTVDLGRMEGVTGPSEGEAMARAAGIEEFVRMVTASLAADRDHTISAGIMSLSRVLFEFRNEISEEAQREIVLTVFPLLAVKNREIVKSVLGFVKLTIHSLSPTILQPQLPNLVPALVACLSTHRHHFKVKIRHIFERLLKKVGMEDIEQFALEGDAEHGGAVKMILNIKKRKERAIRKRAQVAEHEDGSMHNEFAPKKATGDAFEDVLYGSESDVEDSEVEEEAKPGNGVSNRKTGKVQTRGKSQFSAGTRLRMDDDEPMDLLEGATGNFLTSAPKRQRKPGQEASKFRVDPETGKMIIADSDSDNDAVTNKKTSMPSTDEQLVGAAYKDTLVSVDGFTRNPSGAIKFHKDTKKRRKEEMEEMGDMEIDDPQEGHHSKGGVGPERTKKRKEVRIGQEFKAKRAGGDVKKNGVDPYAYLTLSQAGGNKKGRGKAKVSILGKR